MTSPPLVEQRHLGAEQGHLIDPPVAASNASFRYDLLMRGLGSKNPQRFFEYCSTGVSARFSALPSALQMIDVHVPLIVVQCHSALRRAILFEKVMVIRQLGKIVIYKSAQLFKLLL